MQLDSRAGVLSRGQRVLLTQTTASQKTVLAIQWHLRDKCRSCDIAVVARPGLPKLIRTSVPHFCQKMYRQSLVSQPGILPREPPGQAMAVSRGSCRGRALRPPRMLHPVSSKSSHVHPYPRGPPAYEATLPAPIRCHKYRSKRAFGLAAQD